MYSAQLYVRNVVFSSTIINVIPYIITVVEQFYTKRSTGSRYKNVFSLGHVWYMSKIQIEIYFFTRKYYEYISKLEYDRDIKFLPNFEHINIELHFLNENK